MTETFEVIRGLIAAFDQAAKDCRLARQEPSDEQISRLQLAYEEAQTVIRSLKDGNCQSGICAFYLPGFGYPKVYMRRRLNEISALSKAPEKPG